MDKENKLGLLCLIVGLIIVCCAMFAMLDKPAEIRRSYKVTQIGCSGYYILNGEAYVCNDCPGLYQCVSLGMNETEFMDMI